MSASADNLPPTDPSASPADASGRAPGRIQSRVTESEVVCPSCGARDMVAVWDVLEADCNPERADQLASGALLVHACPHCGAAFPLDYPLFYIDRTRRVCAYYPAHQGSLDAFETLFTQAVARFSGFELATLRKREFAMRVVPERHELAEKVSVWRAGLDDELVEVLKATLLDELAARHPERAFSDIQFTGASDGGEKLEFILFTQTEQSDGSVETVPAGSGIDVPAEAYRRLARSLAVRQSIDLHHAPVVDAAWARTVLDAAEGRDAR